MQTKIHIAKLQGTQNGEHVTSTLRRDTPGE